MKKGIVVGVVVVLGLMWSAVAFSNEYDFRKTNWGMNKKEVGEAENAVAFKYEDETYVGESYEGNVGGLDCYINYYYIGEKLARAEYDFGYEATAEYLCIENYKQLKEKLMRKYGEPIQDEYIWIDDVYKDDHKNWGKAVSQNYLLCYARWETNTTRITIILSNRGYGNIGLAIKYRSKELRKFEEEFKEKETLEVF